MTAAAIDASAEADLATALAMLRRIARGRPDNGRPLSGPTGMALAREALAAMDRDW